MQYGVKVTFSRDATNTTWYDSKKDRDDFFDLLKNKGFDVVGLANHERLLINNKMAFWAEKIEKE